MAASISLNNYVGVDAFELAGFLNDRPESEVPLDWLPEANRYTTAVGLTPGRGAILMQAEYLDQIDLTGKLSLRIGDQFGNVREFPNLRCAGNPRCVTGGSSHPVYLVPLTDRRVDLVGTTNLRFQWRYQPWDNVETESTYGPLQGFGSGSRGPSNIGSYELVCRELWNLLADDLGPWPGLPTTVPYRTKSTIDRLDLHGFRIVDALEDCLAAVGCACVYDPTEDTFSIVYFPRAQDNAILLFQRFRPMLVYDESPYTPPQFGPIPSQVSVLFPVWQGGRTGTNSRGYMGVTWAGSVISSGNGTPADGNQTPWASNSTLVTGTVYLQDFTPSRHYDNGHKLEAGAISNRAFQVAAIFYDRLRLGAPVAPFKRVYGGILTDPLVTPGGTFDAVGWAITEDGASTFVARAGLMGCFEIYEELPKSGFTLESGNSGYAIGMPRTPLRTVSGAVRRTGGYYPDLDREQESFGHAGHATGNVSVAGWSMGPLYRRGSALRQGDWISVGTGGRTDHRSRLWRNWQDMGPHDMTRFVKVTSTTTSNVTIKRIDSDTGGPDTVAAYPVNVLTQMGTPTLWAGGGGSEAWAVDANGVPLKTDKVYLAHQGNLATDGKPVWGIKVDQEEIVYDAWYLQVDNTGTSSAIEATTWQNTYTVESRDRPYFESNGWWWCSVYMTAEIASISSSTFTAGQAYLQADIAPYTAPKVVIYAPNRSGGGGLFGIVAYANAPDTLGVYSDIGSFSVSFFCKVDGANKDERSLYFGLTPYPYGYVVAMPGSLTFRVRANNIQLGMRKVRDL
jgi:hypothetical protein